MKLFALLLLIPFVLLNSSCENDRSNSDFRESYDNSFSDEDQEVEKTPEELRAELKAKEEETPLKYIEGSEVKLAPQRKMTRSAGIFRDAEYEPDGAIISGDITNNATLARFKDPKITVYFYSQTNTLIKKQSYVIYEYLDPGSTTHFSFRIDSYPETYDYLEYKIFDASRAASENL